MLKNKTVSELWQTYLECQKTHDMSGIVEDTDKAYRFFEGDHWYGLESGGEQLPIYNFIAPIVRYKTAMVAMNNMSINYSAPVSKQNMQSICIGLSGLAMQKWEALKMDTKCWQVVKNAMIAGDSYAYFYDASGECQIIDRTDVFLGDETVNDISKQPFIIIRERKKVEAVREQAVLNGVSKTHAAQIMPDGDENDGKCTCLLFMQLKDGDLYFARFTEHLIYQPCQVIKGLECYPMASFVCSPKRGSARGTGEVIPLVANQIEVNRNLARRLMNAKLTAYSRLVYSSDRITNPKALTEVGTAIEVEGGGVSSIRDAVNYLTPASMSPDAKNLSDELLAVTKDLSGAGDAALGSVDPTEASGAAIIAVRDQAELPLNEQTAAFRQFVEDIAKIWYRLWCVYSLDGIELSDGQRVSRQMLDALEPRVRIDVSSSTPFSKYARNQAVENLFKMGHITFEEYVSLLDDDSSVPKSRLEHIIKNRGGSLNADRQDRR